MSEVTEKTADELQAEQEQIKAAIANRRGQVLEENERLRAELDALNAASVKKVLCPACGSDGHKHCKPAAHHGGMHNVDSPRE
jgi:hypothetical protein